MHNRKLWFYKQLLGFFFNHFLGVFCLFVFMRVFAIILGCWCQHRTIFKIDNILLKLSRKNIMLTLLNKIFKLLNIYIWKQQISRGNHRLKTLFLIVVIKKDKRRNNVNKLMVEESYNQYGILNFQESDIKRVYVFKIMSFSQVN